MFFVISLSLYGTSIPCKYSIGIQKLNLLPFRKIFLKNREIGSLVGRPSEKTKNRETQAKPRELAGLLFHLCYAYRTSVNQAFGLKNREKYKNIR